MIRLPHFAIAIDYGHIRRYADVFAIAAIFAADTLYAMIFHATATHYFAALRHADIYASYFFADADDYFPPFDACHYVAAYLRAAEFDAFHATFYFILRCYAMPPFHAATADATMPPP